VASSLTDRTIGAAEMAPLVEERGFHAFYLGEHSHIPTSRLTLHPVTGKELDEIYLRMIDPVVALSMAGAVTSELRIGTCVALVAEHDPIVLAKQLATLDQATDGRLVLGIGYGWNQEQAEDHRVDWKNRADQLREHFLAMQALWSQDEGEFHGRFVDFGAAWMWPKPVQQPRPLTLIGGAPTRRKFAHIAEFADGWMPLDREELETGIPKLHEAWAAAGRGPEPPEVVLVAYMPPDAAAIDAYRKVGVTELAFGVTGGTRDQVSRRLDRVRSLAAG